MTSLRYVLALGLTLALPAGVAQADHPAHPWEFDGFLGWHYFSPNNELGVRDVPDAPSPDSSVAFGIRLGYWPIPMLEVEAEGAVMPTSASAGAADSEELIVRYGVNALYQFDVGPVKPFVLAGLGFVSNSSEKDTVLMDDTDFTPQLGVGARYQINKKVGVRADLRLLLPPSSESDGVAVDAEGLIGFYTTFGETTAPAPAPQPAPVAEPSDDDGDGIVGAADQCPTQPEDKDSFQDDDGCPDPDNDNDGIADTDDKCPDKAETKNGIDDEDGCPETDDDGDGLIGSQDKCPTQAEDKDGFQDDDGCPDPDNDNDGVADAQDKCPDKLETMNGFQDDDGCPDEVPKAVQRFTGVIKGINFKTDSADLTRGSFHTLDRAVKILQKYPDLKLEISGHTDNTGDAQHNRELSQSRADTVKTYFTSKGIADDRLVAKGYGPDKPIADNKTRSGRAKNRRVEFKLITGAESNEGAQAPAGDQAKPAGDQAQPAGDQAQPAGDQAQPAGDQAQPKADPPKTEGGAK